MLGLLIWYLDDGYLGKPKNGVRPNGWKMQPKPSIAAKRLDYDQLVQAISVINANLGLSLVVTTNNHRGGVNKLVKIRAADRHRVLDSWRQLAKDYGIPACMHYKLNMHDKEILSWER